MNCAGQSGVPQFALLCSAGRVLYGPAGLQPGRAIPRCPQQQLLVAEQHLPATVVPCGWDLPAPAAPIGALLLLQWSGTVWRHTGSTM
jgi:hypothetical protein